MRPHVLLEPAVGAIQSSAAALPDNAHGVEHSELEGTAETEAAVVARAVTALAAASVGNERTDTSVVAVASPG